MNPTQLSRFSEAVLQAVHAAHEAAEPEGPGSGTPAGRRNSSTGSPGVRREPVPSELPPLRPTLSRPAS